MKTMQVFAKVIGTCPRCGWRHRQYTGREKRARRVAAELEPPMVAIGPTAGKGTGSPWNVPMPAGTSIGSLCIQGPHGGGPPRIIAPETPR